MHRSSLVTAAILILALAPIPAPAQTAKLVERPPDPHGSPRPFREAKDVPVRTSLYLELAAPPGAKASEANPDSVSVSLRPDEGAAVELLGPGRRFAAGALGWLKPKSDLSGARSLAVYIEPPGPLRPATRYTATVRAALGGAKSGAPSNAGTWSFTTEAADPSHRLAFSLDLAAEPVRWHGRFFSGLCNVIFCSQAANYGPTYDLMDSAHKEHPNA